MRNAFLKKLKFGICEELMLVRSLCLGVKCELEAFVKENGFISQLKFWLICFFAASDKEMELLFGDFVLT